MYKIADARIAEGNKTGCGVKLYKSTMNLRGKSLQFLAERSKSVGVCPTGLIPSCVVLVGTCFAWQALQFLAEIRAKRLEGKVKELEGKLRVLQDRLQKDDRKVEKAAESLDAAKKAMHEDARQVSL